MTRRRGPRGGPAGPAAAVAALVLLATACTASDQGSAVPDPVGTSAPTSPPSPTATPRPPTPSSPARPLRRGEDRMTLAMAEPYTPSAPTGVGTDDYRCFLLDPGLTKDGYLTGTNVLPGNPEVVHHVILFRVAPDQVSEAEEVDAATDGPGWTCFGGTGLSADFADIDDANWLGAWAPGGEETVTRRGYGVDLPAGSRIVMQVHYNLLAGASPDTSATQLRVTTRRSGITPLHTYLLPAPVELPCRPAHDDGPLCDRAAAVADVRARFGAGPGAMADVLHLLCASTPQPSTTSSCTRTIGRPMTILGVAGHMHLLGRRITVEVDPGTPRARTVLDLEPWDFDDQGARAIEPVDLEPFDTVRVTCRHEQRLRDLLPSFEGQEEKYVVWGEGTTDEMCLGILSVAFR